jgi:selenocysteine lyase/cysteine desulfurase
VTHVPTNSGLVQDVATIGAACREAGSLYLVDACQSVGQMPLDVQRLGCDFLSATFRKFIRGPRGAGFLYVSDRVLEQGMEPLFIDMRGAEWISPDHYRAVGGATRFETAEFAWALVLGAGEAALYAQRVGLGHINARVRRLAARLRAGLQRIDGVRVLDRGPELCGIVSVVVETMEAPHVVSALRQRGIHASTQFRSYALLDYDDKRVTSSVRLSPHYYNTEAELDRTLDVLADLRPTP